MEQTQIVRLRKLVGQEFNGHMDTHRCTLGYNMSNRARKQTIFIIAQLITPLFLLLKPKILSFQPASLTVHGGLCGTCSEIQINRFLVQRLIFKTVCLSQELWTLRTLANSTLVNADLDHWSIRPFLAHLSRRPSSSVVVHNFKDLL